MESIKKLKDRFDLLKVGKDQLLVLIDESELPEGVYNSNAIENSTLTLKETEKILLEMEASKDISLREVFEAKNLARVSEYIRNNLSKSKLHLDFILLLHQMLLSNISDNFAGRLRQSGEYVRVGTYIAPAPELLADMLQKAIVVYEQSIDMPITQKLALFHVQFEHIHPFCDGNGRMGRLLTNFQLQQLGLPPIIIRNKEKKEYYEAIREYDSTASTKLMERIVYLSIKEALHKRIAYLESKTIVRLTEYAREQNKPANTLLNAAKRQTIPAFRERGVWMIGA